jgi:hypothetical protein
MKTYTEYELDELAYSDEYMTYIMSHSPGDRIICNGDTLLDAAENGYLWKEFLDHIGVNYEQ